MNRDAHFVEYKHFQESTRYLTKLDDQGVICEIIFQWTVYMIEINKDESAILSVLKFSKKFHENSQKL